MKKGFFVIQTPRKGAFLGQCPSDILLNRAERNLIDISTQAPLDPLVVIYLPQPCGR